MTWSLKWNLFNFIFIFNGQSQQMFLLYKTQLILFSQDKPREIKLRSSRSMFTNEEVVCFNNRFLCDFNFYFFCDVFCYYNFSEWKLWICLCSLIGWQIHYTHWMAWKKQIKQMCIRSTKFPTLNSLILLVFFISTMLQGI